MMIAAKKALACNSSRLVLVLVPCQRRQIWGFAWSGIPSFGHLISTAIAN